MDTSKIKSLYDALANSPFPDGLAGEEVDGIDLVLFDADLAGDISQFIVKRNHLTQDEIKKLIRKTQYIISKLTDSNHRSYFEKWEYIFINCLEGFDKSILKRYIRQELQQVDAIDNLHGINLGNIHQHLVEPTQKDFYIHFQDKIETYWIVLDEHPEDLVDGYLIIYSESRNQFGLADKTSNKYPNVGSVVGWYGSFVTTLNGM